MEIFLTVWAAVAIGCIIYSVHQIFIGLKAFIKTFKRARKGEYNDYSK